MRLDPIFGQTLITILVVICSLAIAAPARGIDVERIVSPGGIEAWIVRDNTNPIITMRFAFLGGNALDPAGREGLANMVSGLIDEGAGEFDSKTFRRVLEDRAIRLRFDAGQDTFGGRLKTLVKNHSKAFELLRLALTQARFDPEPISRIRAQIISGLRQALEDPHVISSRALFGLLYPDHPYGRPTDGTIESVNAITVDNIRAFVKRRFGRDNLVIGVVGDFTAVNLGAILDETFSSLPAKAASWAVPEVKPRAEGKILVIAKPVPQSSIIFAEEGIKRNDPDYYTAYVMNHILGGGSFTSRLYSEVREKRGLVYSVYSSLYPMDHSALIIGNAGTANARVAETLRVIGEQWDLMAIDGVTDSEVRDAKTYLTGSFPIRFSSSGHIADILVGMQISALGIDYLDRRYELINEVTKDDVNRIAKKILNTEHMVTVVVGQPQGVTSTQ